MIKPKTTLESFISRRILFRTPVDATGSALAGISLPMVHGKSSSESKRALLITGGCCHDYDRQKRYS